MRIDAKYLWEILIENEFERFEYILMNNNINPMLLETLFLKACKVKNATNVLEYFLESGYFEDVIDEIGVEYAMYYENIGALNLLLNYPGIDFDKVSNDYISDAGKDYEVSKVLIETCKLDLCNAYFVYNISVNNYYDLVEEMLNCNKYGNETFKSGGCFYAGFNMALKRAIKNGDVELIEIIMNSTKLEIYPKFLYNFLQDSEKFDIEFIRGIIFDSRCIKFNESINVLDATNDKRVLDILLDIDDILLDYFKKVDFYEISRELMEAIKRKFNLNSTNDVKIIYNISI